MCSRLVPSSFNEAAHLITRHVPGSHTRYHLIGTPNVQPKSIAWWPENESEWPTDSSTNVRLLRFRWNESWNHADNWKGIKNVSTYVKTRGAARLPEGYSGNKTKLDKVTSSEPVLGVSDPVLILRWFTN